MRKEDLLEHYDYIRRLSQAKCASHEDAEDLISETFLAAYACLYQGGVIEYPRTWLTNTLMHKFNSMLRKKYRQPEVVNYDALELPAPEEIFDCSEEAAEVRRELLYLSETTREVLIRYYYNGHSVADIAARLGIPEGTVKSRLSAGRSKMKKGLTKMTEKKNNIPGTLYVSNSGSAGPGGEPGSLVEKDLIVQNLLILAYEKPLSITELAEAISIPTVYIEPVVKKLTEGELMARNGEGRYYTDFIIYRPQDFLSRFEAQKAFAHERFERFWNIMEKLTAEIDALEDCRAFSVRQLRKLERYGILSALQRFQLELSQGERKAYPCRLDGGRWIAMGRAFPGGYDDREYSRIRQYEIQGGHRSNEGACNYGGAKYLKLCEFDTTLWDNPARWGGTCGFSVYFREMKEFLWCIYRGISVEEGNISNAMLESIDRLVEKTGLLTREEGRLAVDIPVMTARSYDRVQECIQRAYDRLAAELGEEYREYLQGSLLEIPRHLKGIPTDYRYLPATNFLVMSVIREAYEKGLHLADVDYCCPPAVLIYEE